MRHRDPFTISPLLAALPLLFALGCAGDTVAAPAGDPAPATSPAGEPPTAEASDATMPSVALAGKVKFKRDGDTTAFSLKPKDDGAKLVDADEQELARYNVDGNGKIKVKDAGDVVLGWVTGDLSKVKVKHPENQDLAILELVRQDDGDYKLEDGSQGLLAKIKRRDYGWKLENASGEEIGKLKVKDGKTSVRDAGDRTVLYTKDAFGSLAAAALGLAEPLDLDRRVVAGLALKLHLLGAG